MDTTNQDQIEMPNGGEVPLAPLAPTQSTPALTGKRANWTVAHKVEGQGTETVLHFQVKGAGALMLKLSQVSEAVKNRAAVHGLVQRISDSAAMARDAKTGASATAQEKFEAMKRLVEHYGAGSGDWSPSRSEYVRTVRVDQSQELLRLALGIFNPQKEKETIGKFVSGLKKEQVAGLLLSEQLKEAVELAREQIREQEEKMSQGIEVEELLKGL